MVGRQAGDIFGNHDSKSLPIGAAYAVIETCGSGVKPMSRRPNDQRESVSGLAKKLILNGPECQLVGSFVSGECVIVPYRIGRAAGENSWIQIAMRA